MAYEYFITNLHKHFKWCFSYLNDKEYHLLGYDTLHNHRCENLKSYNK
jgi:hypothetical protein